MSEVKDDGVVGTSGGRWEFDAGVAEAFDDMLERSIPQLGVVRSTVFDLACRFQREGADFVDLGCSRGESMARLVDRYGAHNRFVGVEASEPMRAAALERFRGFASTGIVSVRSDDLRLGYPPVRACVTTSVLTLQFTPIEHRQRIVRDAFRHTIPGGALILVEKVLGATADLDALMVDAHHAMKRANGYGEDDVRRKRLSLEGVLVPVTARWNEEILRAAGFQEVDCFWRWMNFAGWLAVKTA